MSRARLAGGALALVAAAMPAGASPAPATTVTCRLAHDANARVYQLARRGEGGAASWTLSMRSGAAGAWIRLALPGASPTFGEGTARLDYHNANGGRQIALDVKPGSARIDVYVDYGLDVNIDPDLDPAVDSMNTNGPVTAVDCTVTAP